jgi:hypothetical protein
MSGAVLFVVSTSGKRPPVFNPDAVHARCCRSATRAAAADAVDLDISSTRSQLAAHSRRLQRVLATHARSLQHMHAARASSAAHLHGQACGDLDGDVVAQGGHLLEENHRVLAARPCRAQQGIY